MSIITEAQTIFDIPTSLIRPDPAQPRKEFDPEYIAALGESIAAEGLLQPITVRPDPEKAGAFIIIAGECRWRAHCHKGLQAVRCMISNDKGDEAKRFRAQVMENMGRRQMTLKEEAFACERMAGLGDSEEVIAKAIGSSAYHVRNLRRMTKMSSSCWLLVEKGMVQPWLVEKVVAVIPEESVEQIMSRCAGKNCKFSSAVIAEFQAQQRQDAFMLAMEQSGIAAKTPDIIRGVVAQMTTASTMLKGVSSKDQMDLARRIGREVRGHLPKGVDVKQSANFWRQVFNYLDAMSGEQSN